MQTARVIRLLDLTESDTEYRLHGSKAHYTKHSTHTIVNLTTIATKLLLVSRLFKR